MMALTNEQLNLIIDQDIRPAAERLRAEKIRVAGLLARVPQYTEFAESAEPVTLTRADAAQLPTISETNLRDFVYALGALNTALNAIDGALLERFCVRPLEI
ncbi:MAG: hypothetical protein ABFD89_04815 [Bryobacteraceae bacterium]